jgi:hypothetical protein
MNQYGVLSKQSVQRRALWNFPLVLLFTTYLWIQCNFLQFKSVGSTRAAPWCICADILLAP